jgi:hypothetical protein
MVGIGKRKKFFLLNNKYKISIYDELYVVCLVKYCVPTIAFYDSCNR